MSDDFLEFFLYAIPVSLIAAMIVFMLLSGFQASKDQHIESSRIACEKVHGVFSFSTEPVRFFPEYIFSCTHPEKDN